MYIASFLYYGCIENKQKKRCLITSSHRGTRKPDWIWTGVELEPLHPTS